MNQKHFGIQVRGFEKFGRWYSTEEEIDKHFIDLKRSYATSEVRKITK